MNLLDPLSLDTNREGYRLLKEILALPSCPWRHHLYPYGERQSAIVQEAITRLSSMLSHTYSIMGVSIIADHDTIITIFTKAIADNKASYAKSLSDFIYCQYTNKSIFLDYYRKEYCEDMTIKRLLERYNIFDDIATKNAFDLKKWYIEHKTALSQLNIGSWVLAGMDDWGTFLNTYLSIAMRLCTVPKSALKPKSYGMMLVDKALQKQDIRLLYRDEEYVYAESTYNASMAEKHKTRYPAVCPIESIGDLDKEVEWRMKHDKLLKERMKKHG